MSFPKIIACLFIAGSLSTVFTGCKNETDCTKIKSKREGNPDVIVHELADPDKLNPATSTSANAQYVENNIFMYLLDVDKEKLEITPSLVKERPKVSGIDEGEFKGGMKLEYEIRPEAVWDNGTPVTGYDVVFSYKSVKNPLVDAEQLRPYLDFIDDVVVDKDNPKKFTVYSKKRYFDLEFSTGGQAYILPEYAYDPNQTMRKFSFQDLNDPKMQNKLRANADIIAFATQFNSEKYQRDAGFVVGCGPYSFTSWTTGQRIILTRKQNWWGDKLLGTAPVFVANPPKITYEIVNDWTTAVTAMKDEGIDVMREIQPKLFNDLQKNPTFLCKYNLYTPQMLAYNYIGINMKSPKLSDVKVREALARLVDRKQIINVLLYGNGIPCYGPVLPAKKYCDTTLTKYEFDMEKAKQLLDEAGWKDSDGDGIRDKVVNGQKLSLELTFKYNSGNDTREKIGVFLQENAKKVGIKVNLLMREWTVFLEETKQHNFDLYCGGWVSDPISDDPKQIWHTQSYSGGSNYVGFGDAKSDATIDSMRNELDPAKIDQYYHDFQREVNEQVPYIFLYVANNRLAIAKRFEGAKAYASRPGYTDRELALGKGATAK